jgi:hypothetical protein
MEDVSVKVESVGGVEPVAASSSDSEYDPNDANNDAAEEDIIVPALPAVAGALVTVAVHRGADGIRCQHSVCFELLWAARALVVNNVVFTWAVGPRACSPWTVHSSVLHQLGFKLF